MQISPAQLACRPHWRAIPWSIRARILREFHRRPGSDAHLAAVGDGIRFLRSLFVAGALDELDALCIRGTCPTCRRTVDLAHHSHAVTGQSADLVEVRTDGRT